MPLSIVVYMCFCTIWNPESITAQPQICYLLQHLWHFAICVSLMLADSQSDMVAINVAVIVFVLS